MGGQLIDVDADAPADAIVVLAGRTPDRELAGIDLFHKHMAPRVLITREIERPQWDLLRARGVHVESALDFRRRILRDLGVPDERVVVLPPVVVSTIGEANAVADWARAHPIKSLIVVTSPPHTARAKMIFTSALAGLGIEVRMHAAEAGTFRADTWWHHRENLAEGISEWQKWLLYHLRFYRSR